MTASRSRRRKVLMITFHYPPSNTSSGGLRPLKFGKYLGEFGWDSSVLTVREACHESIDPALLAQIPAGITVHRPFCLDAKAAFSVRGRYPAFITVPDRYVAWLPFGTRAAVRSVREEGIDVLYSTSPVPTAHLIGLATKRLTGVPWVADFRDPWVETEGSEVHGRMRQAFELRLEKLVVTHADRVLVTTPELGDYLAARYGADVARKIRVAYNGYDEDDFDSLAAQPAPASPFTILHAGLLHPDYRNPIPVLAGMQLCRQRGWLPDSARLEFLGVGAPEARARVAQMAADAGVADVVDAVVRVPYHVALERLAAASVLLLLQGGDDTRMLIPAKAFEYLRTDRPIVALTGASSATARLVREFGGCFVADPADPEAIAGQFAAAHGAWASGGRIDRAREGLDRYSRRGAAAALSKVLDGLVQEGARTAVAGAAEATARTAGAGTD